MNDKINETAIQRVAQVIADALHPEKIVLFGSAARGEMGPDSDIDLFVQMPPGADTGEASAKGYAALGPLYRELKHGVDLVVKDRAFVERYGSLVGSVARAALREGRVLYERV